MLTGELHRHGQNVADLMLLNLSRATKIIISEFVCLTCALRKRKAFVFNL